MARPIWQSVIDSWSNLVLNFRTHDPITSLNLNLDPIQYCPQPSTWVWLRSDSTLYKNWGHMYHIWIITKWRQTHTILQSGPAQDPSALIYLFYINGLPVHLTMWIVRTSPTKTSLCIFAPNNNLPLHSSQMRKQVIMDLFILFCFDIWHHMWMNGVPKNKNVDERWKMSISKGQKCCFIKTEDF